MEEPPYTVYQTKNGFLILLSLD